MLNKEDYIPYALHNEIGFYIYPEIVVPFTAMLEGTATKEQLDYLDSISKQKGIKNRMAKVYDYYQRNYKSDNLNQEEK